MMELINISYFFPLLFHYLLTILLFLISVGSMLEVDFHKALWPFFGYVRCVNIFERRREGETLQSTFPFQVPIRSLACFLASRKGAPRGYEF